jgi:4-amino-4-deoxy-L-arabinose transferase-like glycosyltransferase
MPKSTRRGGSSSFWLLAVTIVLLGVALRLVATLRLPLFLDEALHILRAHRAMEGDLFVGPIRKWLYPVALALLRPTGPEGPWLARSGSALLGALSIACCIALGRLLDDRRTGLLAGLFYAVLPLAVFHERQALTDPMLAAFTTFSTVLSIRLARAPRWWMAPTLGLALAVAYLTKVSALPFAGLPVVAVILFSRDWRTRWRALGLFVLALLIAAGPIAWAYRGYAQERAVGGTSTDLAVDSVTSLIGLGQPGYAKLVRFYLQTYAETVWRYVGVPLLALVALAGVWAALGERRRAGLFLALPGVIFAFIPLLVVSPADFFAPRYILQIAAPLVVLAALGLRITLARLDGHRPGLGRWIGGLALVVTVTPALWFAARLIHDPAQAPLTRIDRRQYISGDPGGSGRDEAARDLWEIWQAGDGVRVDAMASGESAAWLDAHLGPLVGEFLYFRRGDSELRKALTTWLAAGDQVYFLEESKPHPLPDTPMDTRLEPVREYESGAGPLRLYRVTGMDGPLADQVYARLAPAPEKLAADRAALAGALVSGGAQNPVLVFPPHHAPALADLVRRNVLPLSPRVWPLEPGAVEAALAALDLDADGLTVEVVVVDEANVDPQRVLLSTLTRSLYHVGDDWFGLLHRWRFVTGPSDPPLAPLGAQYEGVIELAAGAILNPETRPGGVVRLAMQWRTPVEIEDSFKVFAHVVDEDGTLWAQHDGVPGGGLLPMTAWQPGEDVIDRLAIELPADLPPGEYTIWVGIYHPDSGLRLPVTGGEETGPDYAVFGRFSVVPPK